MPWPARRNRLGSEGQRACLSLPRGCRGCARTPGEGRRASGARRSARRCAGRAAASGAVCPVATTATSSPAKPSTSWRTRFTRPSTRPAKPNTAPACMHSTVFLPTTERGRVNSTRRSAAERAAAASDDTCMPGAIAPPRNSPFADTTSTQMDEPKSTTIAAECVPLECGQAVDDPVGADLLRIVDEQRECPVRTPGSIEHVRHRGPVLLEHHADLVQHRRHRRQTGGAGQPLGVVADQPVDGQGQFVGGDLGLGPDPPVLHHLRVITGPGYQPDDGMGVANVDGKQHGTTAKHQGGDDGDRA